jgi:hypothetical protein
MTKRQSKIFQPTAKQFARLTPPSGVLVPPPTEATTGSPQVLPAMTPLPGEFLITTVSKGTPLSAVKGGGRTTDVIHTELYSTEPLSWQRFRLWVDATKQYYAIQTINGYFLTAVSDQTTNAIQSSATGITTGYALFKLARATAPFAYSIETLGGYYLTAVGGGSKSSGDTIHTDATTVGDWERFFLFRRGDFGSGSMYSIQEWGPDLGAYLTATGGGDRNGQDALTSGGGPDSWITWTLIRQDDGSYAFQTASGFFLSANGGGIAGTFSTETEQDEIGNWNKFTLIDYDNYTYYIQTNSGYYITTLSPQAPIATVSDITKANRWRLFVYAL